jgi:AcrR family transcriptional regulator
MARPRSARAHEDVLDAALQLFAARGIDTTSMDAIAEASGVSKATIYKHWPDKDRLCLEVLAHVHGTAAAEPNSGDLRADLIVALSHRPRERHAELRMRMMPHLMAYAARNPAFGKAWQARVMEPQRSALARVLRRGIAQGMLPVSLDLELATALLLGPMLYGHVLNRIGGEAPVTFQGHVVDAFMRSYGLAGRKDRRRPRRSATTR